MTTATELTPQQVATAARCRVDPAFFGRVILGDEEYTPDQLRIFQAVAGHNAVAVHSGYSCGKTRAAAVAAVWYLATRIPSKVITTAPTGHQINDLLWGEIRAYLKKAERRLPGIPQPKLIPDLRISAEHWAKGIATKNQEVSLQGVHSPNTMVIMDEADGIAPPVFVQAHGISTGEGAKRLIIGNPGKPDGPFFDACRAELWRSVHLSCLNHPNVLTGKNLFPGMVTRQWVEDMKVELGEGTPVYQCKVEGLFPEQGEYALIALSWVEAAMAEEKQVDQLYQDDLISCDVARYGTNETVIDYFKGRRLVEQIILHGRSGMEVAGRIMKLKQDRSLPGRVPIVVDDDGIGGPVLDRLEELGQNVIPFNGGTEAKDPRRWYDKRSEAWGFLANELRDGKLALPDDLKLKAQLTSPKYRLESEGRIRLESKDDMLKRKVPSPDRGDALAMGWWFHAPGPPCSAPKKEIRKSRQAVRSGWRGDFRDISGL